MDLELHEWGDGSVRLYFEDHLHGHDRVFILHADGTATSSEFESDDRENEVLTPVNLVEALRKLLAWHDVRRGE